MLRKFQPFIILSCANIYVFLQIFFLSHASLSVANLKRSDCAARLKLLTKIKLNVYPFLQIHKLQKIIKILWEHYSITNQIARIKFHSLYELVQSNVYVRFSLDINNKDSYISSWKAFALFSAKRIDGILQNYDCRRGFCASFKDVIKVLLCCQCV